MLSKSLIEKFAAQFSGCIQMLEAVLDKEYFLRLKGCWKETV